MLPLLQFDINTPMEHLKIKLLEFGIYGTKLNAFNKEEIDYLYNKDYVEIYHTKDKKSLENNLQGELINKIREYKYIQNNISILNIRIRYNIFKEYLKKYKFKNDFPFQVIDILLNSDDFIKSTDIKVKLNTDPKKIFYVTKKLNEFENLITKKENNYTLLKLKKEGFFESENKEEIFNKPDIPINLKTDVPLLDQIKNLLTESQIGVTTEDVNKQFGISIRQALHYLNKISDNESLKYKHKEIFIGKIKRLLFYSEEESSKRNLIEEKPVEFITSDDRINALNKMLEDKKGFVISEETILQFRLFLNTKFTPCKKTLMSTALKAGHKIFILKEKNESNTLIINKDVSISSFLRETETKIPKFKNSVEEDFYKKFVMFPNYIAQDNFYKNKENMRIELLYEYLLSKSKDGYLLIDKNFISEMNLKLLFQIIPIEIPNIIYEIVEQKNIADGLITEKVRLEDFDKISRHELFTKKLFGKHSKIVKIQIMYKRILKKILDLEEKGLLEKYLKNENYTESINIENLKIENFSRDTTLKIIGKNLELLPRILNEQILIKLTGDYKQVCNKINKNTKKNIYINHEDRIKLFNIVRSNSHTKAYKIIKNFLRKNYNDSYKQIFKNIENIFINVQEDDTLFLQSPNIQEFLYTKIKHDLLKNTKLDPKDFEKYECVDLVLDKLRKDGIITSNEKTTTLTNCYLRSKVKSKLNKKFDITDSKYKIYSERDTIYNIYFNFYYEILVKKGSLEVSDILTKISVCKDFELENFLKAYKDVFEINEVDNMRIISVKIDIDPFDFI